MKLCARRKLIILSILQLGFACALAVSSWVSMLLNGASTPFYSQYARELIAAGEQSETRVHGHTPLEFARLVASSARQLDTYTGVSACASVVVILLAGFQLFLAWSLPRETRHERS